MREINLRTVAGLRRLGRLRGGWLRQKRKDMGLRGHQEKSQPGPLFGIEEEVFITQPERPNLQSLYCLAKLLWTNPRYYYVHSDSNFARGEDVKQGLMGGVEISTLPYSEVADLIDDLAERRRALAATCPDGLLVPLGHLIDYHAPTITCGMHIHVGNIPDLERAYAKLAHFLPILALLTANAPYYDGRYFGQSYRMAHSYAIGPLREDPRYRFQDLIFARRLGTIEIRIFDPIWDLKRLTILLEAIRAIVLSPKAYPLQREVYNRLRQELPVRGYTAELRPLYRELSDLYWFPEEMLWLTPAEQVRRLYEEQGLLATYSALDSGYRYGVFEPQPVPNFQPSLSKTAVGLAAYYMVKLPYKLQKVWREWK